MCAFTYYFPKIAKNTTTLCAKRRLFYTHSCVLKTRSFVGCFGQTRKLLTPPFKGTTDAKKKKKEKKKNGDFTDDDDDAGQGGGNGGRRVVGVVVERWHLAAS